MLQDDLYKYLITVVNRYANQGISPEEGLALYHLNRAILGGRQVDDDQMAKLKIPAEGPASLSVEEDASPHSAGAVVDG